MRRLRRRQRPVEEIPAESLEDEYAPADESFQPFVPVPADSEYGYDDDEESEAAFVVPRRRRLRLPSVHLRRPSISIEAQPGVLLIAGLLVIAGIFGTLLAQDRVQGQVKDWWPAAIVAGAVVWMVGALVQRRVTSFLGGAACAGVGLSLLLDTQAIARFNESLMGIVLVMVGLGIVVRGFVLRQRAPL